jgi:hypothetical protein
MRHDRREQSDNRDIKLVCGLRDEREDEGKEREPTVDVAARPSNGSPHPSQHATFPSLLAALD